MVNEDNQSINTTNAKLLKNYADLLSQKDEKVIFPLIFEFFKENIKKIVF